MLLLSSDRLVNYGGTMQIQLVDEKNYQSEMGDRILPVLAKCKREGWMAPAETTWLKNASGRTSPSKHLAEGRLHYVCYDAKAFDELNVDGAFAGFHGAVVISHGFCEFAAKYSEMIWYFLLAGYSVCVLEHRGHGYSVRDVDNPSLIWIDDWRRYVADLVKFASTIGEQYADSQPLNLFAHSMGAGVGAVLLERYPTIFDKAVLSSPMIAPSTGVPNGLAKVVSGVMSELGFGKLKAAGQTEFSTYLDTGKHDGACMERVSWFHQLRCSDRRYQTNAASFGWVNEALKLSHSVLQEDACANIETPTLLFQAEKDVWVLNHAEDRFASQVTDSGGFIELVRIGNSAHEIFSMPNATLRPYLHRILTFFGVSIVASAMSD